MQAYAVVTGATSGIGKALSELLMKEGYNLILVGRNQEKLRKMEKQLKGIRNQREVKSLVADLQNQEEVNALCNTLSEMQIDLLVNNAGFGITGAFIETDIKKEEEMIQVNLMTLTKITKVLAKNMAAKGKGHIMNIASIAAFMPNPLGAVYAATKAYVLSFSEALAEELRGSGVTVTAVCPGPTKSQFAQRSGMENTGVFSGNVMSAKKVAQLAYRATMKGKLKVIPGMGNKCTIMLAAICPKRIVLVATKQKLTPKK